MGIQKEHIILSNAINADMKWKTGKVARYVWSRNSKFISIFSWPDGLKETVRLRVRVATKKYKPFHG